MIHINLLENYSKEFAIETTGENFNELRELMISGGFSYKKEFMGNRHVWIGGKREMRSVIKSLDVLEGPESVPDYIREYIKAVPETTFIRRPIDRSLMVKPPLGPFQEEGIKMAITQNRLMLAWEMRMGKTFVTGVALNHYWKYDGMDRVLLVAPIDSLLGVVRQFLEYCPFWLNPDDIYIADVDNRHPFENDPKLIAMTYRTFLMLADEFHEVETGRKVKNPRDPSLPFGSWGHKRAVILDESHYIKNLTARQTKALHLHKDFFDIRIELSGTPDPKSIDGYYSQLNFLDDGVIEENYYPWLEGIASLGNRFSKYAINYFKERKVEEFTRKISPWVSRKFLKDNLVLPEMIEDPVYVRLSSVQREIYQELTKYTLFLEQQTTGEANPRAVKNKFPFILQALDNPELLKGKISKDVSPRLYTLVEKWKFEDHSKLDTLDSLLSKFIDDQNKKVILRSWHPTTLDSLFARYAKYSPCLVHGEADTGELNTADYRDQQIKRFINDPNCKLFVVSSLLLTKGVDLTASSRVIYFDIPTNPEPIIQSKMRVQGVNQKESILINFLLFQETLEEDQFRNIDTSMALNDSLFNLPSLTIDQWRDIFAGKSQRKRGR